MPKYTAMHQQQYVIQPANTHGNLNIQPPKKIWKMESDGSLAPPLTRQGQRLTVHCFHLLHCRANQIRLDKERGGQYMEEEDEDGWRLVAGEEYG